MVTVERRVAASPAAVFAVLRDGWSYSNWVVGTSRIRDVDADFPAVGTRIHHSFGTWPVLIDDNTEVLACEHDARLRLKARGWPMGEAVVDITLRPLPEGCLVSIQEDAVSGPGRLVPPPVRQALIGPRNVESLRRLAFMAENRAR